MQLTARAGVLGGAGVLGALSALHLAWAAGSTWPAGDEAGLAAVTAGADRMPGRGPCLVVGGGLAVAAAVVAGLGGRRRGPQLARTAVATGFLIRGVAGLTGNTGRLVPWTPAPAFVRLDRRFYGPLCLLISAAAAASRTERRITDDRRPHPFDDLDPPDGGS